MTDAEPRDIAALFDVTSDSVGDERSEQILIELGLTTTEVAQVIARIRGSHSEVLRLRRRENELAVLYSSARELAQVRDVDSLLQRLVNRAHEMMGTDVTYLSEFDVVTRDLNVRKTAGAVSPELRELQVPAGAGLVSAIAESRSALWVPNYSEYTASRHDDAVDAAIVAEGLVSILGVPMLSDGQILGVLFAADRRERRFTADQIALLSALADHASVVLQTARVLDRAEESAAEARRALNELREHVSARDKSNVVHQDLIHAVLHGGGYSQVARTLSNALERRITVIDAELHTLVTSSDEQITTNPLTLTKVVADAVDESRRTGRCVFVPGDSTSIELVSAITAGESFLGAILLNRSDAPLGPVEERTVERAAQVAAILVLQHSASAAADRRARDELVADLLSAAPERRRDLDRRARNHGVMLSELDTVLVVSVSPELRHATLRAVQQNLPAGAIAAEHAGLIAVISESGNPAAAATIAHRQIAGSVGPHVVVIAPARANLPEHLPQRFTSALRTARLLDALGTTNGAATTASYLPYATLFGDNPDALHDFINHAIGPVLDYDRNRETDLTATLRALVHNQGSPTKAARALNYHPNTVVQRLERIRTLLGDTWRDEEPFFRVSMAVRLEELRQRDITDTT
ncbi:GAF domain-containing protein [Rhodococcus sp. IEGM 1366]|uniref:helix-turn-helix domain-containing protein n=1 Tax=Rhodococcus sp. IEGM 1366 TaxID=3082223 RepID=UPI0029531E11|nr:GAF domain-containing protein [Rhodococcus sp. IEGM 1366]MDV8066539.1 GAF domain-containing protein [Rhodococcus sp. IEGM 1366]